MKFTFIAATLCVFALILMGAVHLHFEAAAAELIFDQAEAPNAYTAIVLGARVYPNGKPAPPLQERLDCALNLFRRGNVQRILVSGDHGQNHYDEVNVMRAWLLARGVPNSVVFMDHAGFRTFDTMRRAHDVFEVRDAIICTHAFHLPRSIKLARHAGISAVGVPADQRADPYARNNQIREFVAQQVAMFDMLLPWRTPRFLGPKIPITSDARYTHDHKSRQGLHP